MLRVDKNPGDPDPVRPKISRFHFFDFSDFSLFVGGLQIFRKYSAKALGYSVVTSLFLLQNFFRTFH